MHWFIYTEAYWLDFGRIHVLASTELMDSVFLKVNLSRKGEN